ncbi:hypothetical protein HZA40_04660 [Candidatus Peregrinibacteria bacterium]|nr:hypothetical protein [Candidatus Peregrinibacteria bacterium]
MANDIHDTDRELVTKVAQSLNGIDVQPHDRLEELLTDIFRICQDVQAKAIKAATKDYEYELIFEVDHNSTPGEIRLYIKSKAKWSIKRPLTFPAPQTNILILNQEGYRQTTPDDINRTGHRLPSYSRSSYTNIRQFLKQFHDILAQFQPKNRRSK